MAKVTFSNHLVSRFSFDKLLLKTFIPVIFLEEKVVFEKVDYIFCSDDYLLSLNKQFLDHDTFTDILTFSLADPDAPVLSEIYISIDRVKENAVNHSVSFEHELYRVMIHGILHLCGYKDGSSEEKALMTLKEDYYLEKLLS